MAIVPPSMSDSFPTAPPSNSSIYCVLSCETFSNYYQDLAFSCDDDMNYDVMLIMIVLVAINLNLPNYSSAHSVAEPYSVAECISSSLSFMAIHPSCQLHQHFVCQWWLWKMSCWLMSSQAHVSRVLHILVIPWMQQQLCYSLRYGLYSHPRYQYCHVWTSHPCASLIFTIHLLSLSSLPPFCLWLFFPLSHLILHHLTVCSQGWWLH